MFVRFALILSVLQVATRQLFRDEGTVWNRIGYVMRIIFADLADEYREAHLWTSTTQIYSKALVARLRAERLQARMTSVAFAMLSA